MNKCPVCGVRCVWHGWADIMECPDHGRISGLVQMVVKGMSPLHALLEIRAWQYKDEIWRIAMQMRNEIALHG